MNPSGLSGTSSAMTSTTLLAPPVRTDRQLRRNQLPEHEEEAEPSGRPGAKVHTSEKSSNSGKLGQNPCPT
jgi:hypothetical protein